VRRTGPAGARRAHSVEPRRNTQRSRRSVPWDHPERVETTNRLEK
jgi:hypothetical protein